jgi:hypothetical protein
MLNIVHKLFPGPANVALHVFGMLRDSNSGDFKLLAHGKEGNYFFIAVNHSPLTDQENMAGIYAIQCAKKGRGKPVAVLAHSEHAAPFDAACCPRSVLKAAVVLNGNSLFRETSERFHQSKKAMSELKIGDIVLFGMGFWETSTGQLFEAARYVNRDAWERLSDVGPATRMVATPQSLYRYMPKVVYPELLDPIACSEGATKVAGFFFASLAGENKTIGRPYTEGEIARIRTDRVQFAQRKLHERSSSRTRMAFL